ncbi:hypothetical protein JHW43_007544 [Diplocarpon mali]|nr:hypothetical protein JHW43_007544 [Diplocarpon mali]
MLQPCDSTTPCASCGHPEVSETVRGEETSMPCSPGCVLSRQTPRPASDGSSSGAAVPRAPSGACGFRATGVAPGLHPPTSHDSVPSSVGGEGSLVSAPPPQGARLRAPAEPGASTREPTGARGASRDLVDTFSTRHVPYRVCTGGDTATPQHSPDPRAESCAGPRRAVLSVAGAWRGTRYQPAAPMPGAENHGSPPRASRIIEGSFNPAQPSLPVPGDRRGVEG